MPVDLYIGPKKRGAPWWQGCILSIIILVVGAYLIILLLASNGIYVSSRVPLPQSLQPTPTATPKPTETAQSHMQKGDALFVDGQFEQAIAEYQAVIALEPLNDTAYAKMVKPLILLRKFGDAVNAGKRAMQINDQRPENMGALAEALDWQGNYDDAINLALRATELNPNYAKGYAYAAEIYADMNRPDKGLPAALKAVQLDDSSVDAHRNLAYVYEAMGYVSAPAALMIGAWRASAGKSAATESAAAVAPAVLPGTKLPAAFFTFADAMFACEA